MTTNDYAKFLAEINKTADAFGQELTPGRTATYFEELSDLSLDAVIGAFQFTRKTQTFFPKIAELRKFAEGSADDRAELSWRTFLDLVRSEGAYPSLQVYDGGIAYAIECLGGWSIACAKLNEASPEMAASYEKNFKNSYKLGQMRNEPPRYIVGQIEASNRSLGTWKSPTVEQPVCLVKPGHIAKVTMPLELSTGQLSADARAALQAGGDSLRRYLPAKPPAVTSYLPAADEEMATPAEVAQINQAVKRIASGNVVMFGCRRSAEKETA